MGRRGAFLLVSTLLAIAILPTALAEQSDSPFSGVSSTLLKDNIFIGEYYTLLLGFESMEEVVYAMGFDPQAVYDYGFIKDTHIGELYRDTQDSAHFVELDKEVRGHVFVVLPRT